MDVTPKKIYEVALTFVGKDASPSDYAPDELGCAETVSSILRAAGCDLPVLVSTVELNSLLKKSSRWESIDLKRADAGDVIMSPTGMGGRNGITHGHTGIVIENRCIASNDSSSGKFLKNYTIPGWVYRYQTTGNYPIYIYRRIAVSLPSAVSTPVSEEEKSEEEKIEVATKAIAVAQEAIKKPSLIAPALALLRLVMAFLKVDKLGALLGFSGKIERSYLG